MTIRPGNAGAPMDCALRPRQAEDEQGEAGEQAARSAMRVGAGGRDPAADAQRRDPHPLQRQQRRNGRRGWHADQDDQIADDRGSDLVGEVPRAGDGGVGQRGLQQREDHDAEQGAEQGADHGVDRRDDADLAVRGPDQPQRRIALLPPGGGEAGGGADQDQDREQEGDRGDDERVAEVARPDLPARCSRDLVHDDGGAAGRPASPARSRRRSPAQSARSAPAARWCRPACRGTGRLVRRPARCGSAPPGPGRRSTARWPGASRCPAAPAPLVRGRRRRAARWSGPGRCRCCSSTVRSCGADA